MAPLYEEPFVVAVPCAHAWAQRTTLTSAELKQQTMLINHYGLNVMDPQARTFLTRNMDAYLFKKGDAEDVDTTKQGTINW